MSYDTDMPCRIESGREGAQSYDLVPRPFKVSAHEWFYFSSMAKLEIHYEYIMHANVHFVRYCESCLLATLTRT